jgi:hypothetical protein
MGLFMFFSCNLVLAALVFYFSKSSKEMPKNWKEFVIECKVQYCGISGVIEDIILRRRNRIGESKGQKIYSYFAIRKSNFNEQDGFMTHYQIIFRRLQ